MDWSNYPYWTGVITPIGLFLRGLITYSYGLVIITADGAITSTGTSAVPYRCSAVYGLPSLPSAISVRVFGTVQVVNNLSRAHAW